MAASGGGGGGGGQSGGRPANWPHSIAAAFCCSTWQRRRRRDVRSLACAISGGLLIRIQIRFHDSNWDTSGRSLFVLTRSLSAAAFAAAAAAAASVGAHWAPTLRQRA